jgi:hypothetical protein
VTEILAVVASSLRLEIGAQRRLYKIFIEPARRGRKFKPWFKP